MEIETTRFGRLVIEASDIVQFPAGLPGLSDCTHWVLLADDQNDALGWLQDTAHPEIALAVVSPRRFVPGYQMRVSRGELGPLADAIDEVHVLAIVNKNEEGITLNLKAPLLIHLQKRIGRQVIASGDQPLQHPLTATPAPRKKIA